MDDTAKDTLDDREPCPDDLCTGIIGDNGRCGTCGRKREGPPPAKKASPAVNPDEDFPETEEAESGAGDEKDGKGASAQDEERIPCPDDLCTGIIGPDGRCGTCGRRM